MKRYVICAMLAVSGVLASTNAADACHRRRSCHGCSGGTAYYGGCSGSVSRGCHGGCNGGAVYYGNGGRVSYYPNQQVVPQSELVPAPSNRSSVETQTNVGVINFRAPTDAQIWVDGQLVNRSGDAWRYTTPSLRTGQRQSYQVKGSWKVDGRTVNQTRTVTVQPGGQMTVDFTQPSSNTQPRNERINPPTINPKDSNP